MPQVSIFMPVLNGARTIAKAIESAQRQTIKDIEIVVVDDGSTDATADIVRSYAAKDNRIKLITLEKNLGGAGASNVALENCVGDWVAVLDADDWYEPNRLEVFLKAVAETNADAVCDNLKLFDHVRNDVVEETRFNKSSQLMVLNTETYFRRDNPLQRHSIGYIQPMISRKFLTDHKISYDANHRYAYDFIFVADILLNGAKLVIVPGAYYTYVHRISPTTRKRSPHSRSEAGHRLILRGCDEILVKYKTRMTPAEHQAMVERRYIFESRVICEDMLDALQERKFFKAAGILIRRPFILVLIACTIGKMVYANILNFWRKIRKYKGTTAYA